jgi:hypothetical protein
MVFAVIEGIGYRQMTAFFRAQGVLRYVSGATKWELVTHRGVTGSVSSRGGA